MAEAQFDTITLGFSTQVSLMIDAASRKHDERRKDMRYAARGAGSAWSAVLRGLSVGVRATTRQRREVRTLFPFRCRGVRGTVRDAAAYNTRKTLKRCATICFSPFDI